MKNIGKYTLEAEIGHGGFGRVYRAFDPTVGRTVAIKILIADKDKDLIARFKREATATGKLRHANIITVYDYGQQDNSPYIVMEYLEGRDLNQALLSRQVMTLLEKTSIMGQVAEGLQYAHHHGIVHRDVKPANIMILSDATVKIMDFGIARVLRDDTTRLTQAGNFLGTLSYMAPEVFRGTDVNHLCDIFSYGVIYYELISGKHPFAADDSARVIYNITSVNPPLLNTLSPDCPPGLAQIIARSMHKDRELRYQSLEDLLFDLMPIRMQLQSVEAQGLIQKAEALFGAGKITEAHTVIKQVIQLDPNNTVVRNLRERINRESQLQAARERCEQLIASGKEQLNSLQHAKAVESFEAALRLDPESSEAQNLLEKVRMAARQRERAEALLVQAKRELHADQITDAYRSILECFQYAPESEEAAALLKTIRTAIERRERQRRLDDSVAKVEGFIAANKLEEAEGLLSDLEITYPGAGRVKELLSTVRLEIESRTRRRRLEEGLDPVRKLLSQGNWTKAIAALDRLAKEFPGETEILTLSAQAQEQLLAQQKAEHIEKLLRDSRTANEAHDFERALDLVKEGLRSYPGEASLEAMLNSTEELRREYQRQIAIRSATERAAAFMARNDFPAALGEIDLALSTLESSELREFHRQIETKRGEYEQAQAVQKACSSMIAYLDKGFFEEAKAAGQQALIDFPGESSLDALMKRAEAGLAEQVRQSRIKAIHKEVASRAANGQLSSALDAARNGLHEFPGEASLAALQERIQSEHDEKERRQAIAACVLRVQGLIEKREYAEAIKTGQAALLEFSGETSISSLIDSAERRLAEEKIAKKVSVAQEEARKLASAGDFPAALTILKNSIRELGTVPALQELTGSIEKQLVAQEKQNALHSAEARAGKLMKSREYSQVVTLLEGTLKEYPGEAVLETLLVQAHKHLAAEERSRNIDAVVRDARKIIDKGDLKSALTIARSGAKTYPDENRLDDLVEEIKAAMAKVETERTVRAALESAASLQSHGQFSNAAQLLEQALLKAPGRAELLEELGRVQEKVVRQKDVNAAIDKVCELMSREMFAEALEGVQNALVAFPGEVAFSSLLEEVRKSQKSYSVAAACRKVETLRASGDLEGARRRGQELSSEFPSEPSVAALNSRIQGEIADKQKQQKVAALTAEVRGLLDREDVDTAIVKLDEAIRQHPGESEISSLHAYAKEIVAARQRADAVADLIKQSRKLLDSGKPREAHSLLKNGVARYSGEESLLALLTRAEEAVSVLDKSTDAATRRDKVLAQARSEIAKKRWDSAAGILEEGIVLFPNDAELRAELEHLREKTSSATQLFSTDPVVPKPVEPIVKTPVKPAAQVPLSKPVSGSLVRKAAVALLGLVVVGFIVWGLLPKSVNYDQQLAAAKSFLEQKDFGKAKEALQQIPSTSPLYKQVPDLLNAIRNGEKQNEIVVLLADAERLLKDGQYDSALVDVDKALNLDPSNAEAESVRNRINGEKNSKLSAADKEKAFVEAIAKAEGNLKSGDLRGAQSKNNDASSLLPNDPRAKTQKRLIDDQLAAEGRMNAELQKVRVARVEAANAKASDVAPILFQMAQTADKDAQALQNEKQWDAAAKTYLQATGLYQGAVKEAVTRQEQGRNAALSARTSYEQILARAKAASADTKTAALYSAAENAASDARARLDRGDFTGARDGFVAASTRMQQAADEAARVAQVPTGAAAPPPPPAGPTPVDQTSITAMNNARNTMNDAKRATPAGDTRKAAGEESKAQQLEKDGKFADAATAYRNAATYYNDAAILAKNAVVGETERQAITVQLERFRSAYEKRSIADVRAVYKKLPAAIEQNLADRQITSIRMELVVGDIQLLGDMAVATCKRTVTIRSQGKDYPASDQAVFNLRKESGSWIIQSIDSKK
jgi:serine/threonine protein kinase